MFAITLTFCINIASLHTKRAIFSFAVYIAKLLRVITKEKVQQQL